ncbi:MAG: type II toxin-antitoxin system RelE/ParE family toxin [Spirochaetes bacterium]|nr:type II toxin-antitoxin system RelE/ParE family toxin [Spirochaetota bacterium]
MAFNLIWSPTAHRDIKDIADYLSEYSLSASKRIVAGIFEDAERLHEFPESGRVVPEFDNPSIREIVRKPFRIVYRVDDTRYRIEIVRIWHSARGTPNI